MPRTRGDCRCISRTNTARKGRSLIQRIQEAYCADKGLPFSGPVNLRGCQCLPENPQAVDSI